LHLARQCGIFPQSFGTRATAAARFVESRTARQLTGAAEHLPDFVGFGPMNLAKRSPAQRDPNSSTHHSSDT
jgi:hypothetical protein